ATRHEQIVENLLCRRTGHFHPTTLIRAAAFEAVGGYRTEYQWIEDHDLWLRLSSRGQLANLTDVVLRYRQHTGSVCWQRAAQQRQLMNQLLRQAHQQRGLDVPDSVLAHPAQSRSAAGPGKWARAAAKGGFPVSVHKHLRELFKSHAATRYKFRMFAESVARLMVSFPLRLLRESAALPSGNYDAWHTKWRQHQGRERAA
ncbi:MAG: hypothetical protein KDA51_17495, partial [Planctomycetales bacterium]|nr:hypothetical protein [Planctomycetales bacterium]